MPATLSLTLGAPASFGSFVPGVAKTYAASTTATVTSTAGDATLSASGATLSNDAFSLAFSQSIAADEALRTGSYSATVTLTLSTTNP